jgi:hypothetical protein
MGGVGSGARPGKGAGVKRGSSFVHLLCEVWKVQLTVSICDAGHAK